MKHTTRRQTSAPTHLQLALSKHAETKEDLICIKTSDGMTEIAVTLDQSRALVESLTRLLALHTQHHDYLVERARLNAKVPAKTREVASGQ